MNREHWKELLPIITAFANGEKMEFRGSERWVEMTEASFRRTAKDYRIAPRTIRIGNYDVPEPHRGEINDGQDYYCPASDQKDFYLSSRWNSQSFDFHRIKHGLIHLTPEAAELHGKALASLTAGEGVEL